MRLDVNHISIVSYSRDWQYSRYIFDGAKNICEPAYQSGAGVEQLFLFTGNGKPKSLGYADECCY